MKHNKTLLSAAFLHVEVWGPKWITLLQDYSNIIHDAQPIFAKAVAGGGDSKTVPLIERFAFPSSRNKACSGQIIIKLLTTSKSTPVYSALCWGAGISRTQFLLY